MEIPRPIPPSYMVKVQGNPVAGKTLIYYMHHPEHDTEHYACDVL
jgi:hypothetical protein